MADFFQEEGSARAARVFSSNPDLPIGELEALIGEEENKFLSIYPDATEDDREKFRTGATQSYNELTKFRRTAPISLEKLAPVDFPELTPEDDKVSIITKMEDYESRLKEENANVKGSFLRKGEIESEIQNATTAFIRDALDTDTEEDEIPFIDDIAEIGKRFSEGLISTSVAPFDRDGSKLAWVNRRINTDPDDDGKFLYNLATGAGSIGPALAATGAGAAVGAAIGGPAGSVAGGKIAGGLAGGFSFNLATRANEAYRTTYALTNDADRATNSVYGQFGPAAIDTFSDMVLTRVAKTGKKISKELVDDLRAAKSSTEKIAAIRKHQKSIVGAARDGFFSEGISEMTGDIAAAYGLADDIQDEKAREARDNAFETFVIGGILGGTIGGAGEAVSGKPSLQRAVEAGMTLDEVIDPETLEVVPDLEGKIRDRVVEKAKTAITESTADKTTEELVEMSAAERAKTEEVLQTVSEAVRSDNPVINEEFQIQQDLAEFEALAEQEIEESPEPLEAPSVEPQEATVEPSEDQTQPTGIVEPVPFSVEAIEQLQETGEPFTIDRETGDIIPLGKTQETTDADLNDVVSAEELVPTKLSDDPFISEIVALGGITSRTKSDTRTAETDGSRSFSPAMNNLVFRNADSQGDGITNPIDVVADRLGLTPDEVFDRIETIDQSHSKLMEQAAGEAARINDSERINNILFTESPELTQTPISDLQVGDSFSSRGFEFEVKDVTPERITVNNSRFGESTIERIEGLDDNVYIDSPTESTRPELDIEGTTQTKPDTDETTKLNRANEAFKEVFPNIEVTVETAPEGFESVAADLTDLFGAEIQFYSEGTQDYVSNGFYRDGVVYVNKDTNVNFTTIIGHELTHHMAETNPELYADLQNQIDPLFNQGRFNEYAERLLLSGYKPDEVTEEIIANIIGESLSNIEALRTLEQSLPVSLYRRFLNWFKENLQRFSQRMFNRVIDDSDDGTLSVLENAWKGIEVVENFLNEVGDSTKVPRLEGRQPSFGNVMLAEMIQNYNSENPQLKIHNPHATSWAMNRNTKFSKRIDGETNPEEAQESFIKKVMRQMSLGTAPVETDPLKQWAEANGVSFKELSDFRDKMSVGIVKDATVGEISARLGIDLETANLTEMEELINLLNVDINSGPDNVLAGITDAIQDANIDPDEAPIYSVVALRDAMFTRLAELGSRDIARVSLMFRKAAVLGEGYTVSGIINPAQAATTSGRLLAFLRHSQQPLHTIFHSIEDTKPAVLAKMLGQLNYTKLKGSIETIKEKTPRKVRRKVQRKFQEKGDKSATTKKTRKRRKQATKKAVDKQVEETKGLLNKFKKFVNKASGGRVKLSKADSNQLTTQSQFVEAIDQIQQILTEVDAAPDQATRIEKLDQLDSIIDSLELVKELNSSIRAVKKARKEARQARAEESPVDKLIRSKKKRMERGPVTRGKSVAKDLNPLLQEYAEGNIDQVELTKRYLEMGGSEKTLLDMIYVAEHTLPRVKLQGPTLHRFITDKIKKDYVFDVSSLQEKSEKFAELLDEALTSPDMVERIRRQFKVTGEFTPSIKKRIVARLVVDYSDAANDVAKEVVADVATQIQGTGIAPETLQKAYQLGILGSEVSMESAILSQMGQETKISDQAVSKLMVLGQRLAKLTEEGRDATIEALSLSTKMETIIAKESGLSVPFSQAARSAILASMYSAVSTMSLAFITGPANAITQSTIRALDVVSEQLLRNRDFSPKEVVDAFAFGELASDAKATSKAFWNALRHNITVGSGVAINESTNREQAKGIDDSYRALIANRKNLTKAIEDIRSGKSNISTHKSLLLNALGVAFNGPAAVTWRMLSALDSAAVDYNARITERFRQSDFFKEKGMTKEQVDGFTELVRRKAEAYSNELDAFDNATGNHMGSFEKSQYIDSFMRHELQQALADFVVTEENQEASVKAVKKELQDLKSIDLPDRTAEQADRLAKLTKIEREIDPIERINSRSLFEAQASAGVNEGSIGIISSFTEMIIKGLRGIEVGADLKSQEATDKIIEIEQDPNLSPAKKKEQISTLKLRSNLFKASKLLVSGSGLVLGPLSTPAKAADRFLYFAPVLGWLIDNSTEARAMTGAGRLKGDLFAKRQRHMETLVGLMTGTVMVILMNMNRVLDDDDKWFEFTTGFPNSDAERKIWQDRRLNEYTLYLGNVNGYRSKLSFGKGVGAALLYPAIFAKSLTDLAWEGVPVGEVMTKGGIDMWNSSTPVAENLFSTYRDVFSSSSTPRTRQRYGGRIVGSLLPAGGAFRSIGSARFGRLEYSDSDAFSKSVPHFYAAGIESGDGRVEYLNSFGVPLNEGDWIWGTVNDLGLPVGLIKANATTKTENQATGQRVLSNLDVSINKGRTYPSFLRDADKAKFTDEDWTELLDRNGMTSKGEFFTKIMIEERSVRFFDYFVAQLDRPVIGKSSKTTEGKTLRTLINAARQVKNDTTWNRPGKIEANRERLAALMSEINRRMSALERKVTTEVNKETGYLEIKKRAESRAKQVDF